MIQFIDSAKMADKVEVSQISEREYIVGRNNTSFIDPNIIFVVANGEQTDELANKQSEVNHMLASNVEGKIHYLIDLNNCGKNSPVARNKWNELSGEEKTDKVAIFGMHPVAKVIASFVMKVSNKKNQKFFTTKDEALQWLTQS